MIQKGTVTELSTNHGLKTGALTEIGWITEIATIFQTQVGYFIQIIR